VNQIVSQNAPLEIKTLANQDMTVWPQGNLRLWAPNGSMVVNSIDARIITDSTLSLYGQNDATLACSGNVQVLSLKNLVLGALGGPDSTIKISGGLPGPYANNAAASGAGLVAGDLFYDSSDPRHICIAY